MVKLLQRKFIFVAMGSLLVVLVMVLGGINLVHVYQSEQRSDGILWMLASYQGEFPEEKKARKFLENYEYREDTQSQTNEQQEETAKQPMNDSRYETYQSMWFLRQLLNAEPHISPETKFSTRYFTVSIDTANTITDVNVSHIAAIVFSPSVPALFLPNWKQCNPFCICPAASLRWYSALYFCWLYFSPAEPLLLSPAIWKSSGSLLPMQATN